MAGLKARAVLAALAVVTAEGCFMGYRSWGYEEDARIDGIIARGREPLEEEAAQGIPVPNVPRSADSLVYTKWEPIKKEKSKPIKIPRGGSAKKGGTKSRVKVSGR
ncbi:MAG: hypothetical protein ACOX6T_22865 [Myxococcales bacterium]|jgi:hypothetical protein